MRLRSIRLELRPSLADSATLLSHTRLSKWNAVACGIVRCAAVGVCGSMRVGVGWWLLLRLAAASQQPTAASERSTQQQPTSDRRLQAAEEKRKESEEWRERRCFSSPRHSSAAPLLNQPSLSSVRARRRCSSAPSSFCDMSPRHPFPLVARTMRTAGASGLDEEADSRRRPSRFVSRALGSFVSSRAASPIRHAALGAGADGADLAMHVR